MGPFYRLQDISSGYWVLVLHFTRREAVRQMDDLQHVATNLGRSNLPLSHSWKLQVWSFWSANLNNCSFASCLGRAWLYLALNESSLESYLRLFQENQALLHKYYFKWVTFWSYILRFILVLLLIMGWENFIFLQKCTGLQSWSFGSLPHNSVWPGVYQLWPGDGWQTLLISYCSSWMLIVPL